MLYFIVVFGGVFVVLSLLSVVANDSGPPFQGPLGLTLTLYPDPRNGGPPEWRTPGMGGRYGCQLTSWKDFSEDAY